MSTLTFPPSEPPPKRPKLVWEPIDTGGETSRAKVFGGWLVKVENSVMHIDDINGIRDGWDWRPALTFAPDRFYEWELEREQ